MQYDFETFSKIQWYINTADRLQQVTTIMNQMNFDHLYIKYGLKYFYLMQAVEHYQITQDPDVKDFEKSQ